MKMPKHMGKGIVPRVVKILEKVDDTCLLVLHWSTGEVKVIDFKKMYFPHWENPLEPGHVLLDLKLFKTVHVGEDGTLNWADGNSVCPDVLYDLSEPLEKFELKRKRVAALSGKTKKTTPKRTKKP